MLVVDDDPRYLRFLSQHLKTCGLDSVHVGSGQDGIRLCADDKPDLILLNWFRSDGLSGHDTCALRLRIDGRRCGEENSVNQLKVLIRDEPDRFVLASSGGRGPRFQRPPQVCP